MLHPQKCTLAQQEVNYLGHMVSKKGIMPDPGKIEAVKEIPVPMNVRAVHQFLYLVYALTFQDILLIWTQECHNALFN